jgi:hypothetical protein
MGLRQAQEQHEGEIDNTGHEQKNPGGSEGHQVKWPDKRRT